MITTKRTSFINYWPFFKQEAKDRGFGKQEFMELCGLPASRYSPFDKGKLNLTAHYFIKLTEGLRLNTDYVEKKSKIPLTEEQRKAMSRAVWIQQNEPLLDTLNGDKKLTKAVKKFIEDYKAKKSK